MAKQLVSSTATKQTPATSKHPIFRNACVASKTVIVGVARESYPKAAAYFYQAQICYKCGSICSSTPVLLPARQSYVLISENDLYAPNKGCRVEVTPKKKKEVVVTPKPKVT